MKRFFNAKLYFEGLKQLRLIGFLALAAMEVITVLVLLGTAEPLPYINELHITFLDFNPSLLGTFTLAAPLMTLYLFSFLNKRNTSDFYHAIPVKRTAIFFSFFLAIVTWLAVLFIITTVTAGVFCLALGSKVTVDVLSILLATCNLFAACLLVTASVAIAMSITGTVFTNILVSLMIIFVPRVLMLIVSQSVVSFVPIIPQNTLAAPLDTVYNVPFGVMFGLLDGSMNTALTFWQGGLYTTGLGLVYAAIAAVLFARRKSEAAGRSAPNRMLQAVYRLVIATVICLPPCWAIVEEYLSDYSAGLLYLINWYAVAVLVYFAYELITTRKWKNLLKAIPGLGILVAINVGIIVSSISICNYNLQFSPTPEQIASVSVINTDSGYLNALSSTVEIKNKDVKKTVAEALEDTVALLMEKGSREYHRSELSRIRVKIRVDGTTYDRYVLMSGEQEQTLTHALQQETDFKEMYMTLPKPSDHPLYPTNYSIVTNAGGVDAASLYEILQTEIREMGFENWFTYNTGTIAGVYTKESDPVERDDTYVGIHLRIQTYVNDEWCVWHIPLSNLLPKTCSAAVKLVNKEADIEKVLEAMANVQQDNSHKQYDGWFDVTMHGAIDEQTGKAYDFTNGYSLNSLSDEAIASMREWIDEMKDAIGQPINLDQPFYFINVSIYHYNDEKEENTNATFFVAANPDGSLPAFLTMDKTLYD